MSCRNAVDWFGNVAGQVCEPDGETWSEEQWAAVLAPYAAMCPDDVYGNPVSAQTDGITDTYTVSGYAPQAFPHGTTQGSVYLSLAIMVNLATARAQLQGLLSNAYSLDTRWNLNAIYNLAKKNGLTNRAAYIEQLFTWAQNIIIYIGTYITTVQAATTAAEVAAITPNINAFGSDPGITALGALAINS